jgi:ectoine hydroxylase-related dioxygenase (phytanoyl-CoA dioxygenase family)
LDDARLAELRAITDAELAIAASEQRGQWDLLENAPGAARSAVFRLSRVMARHPAIQAVAQDERVAEAVRVLVGPDAVLCVNRHNMMVVKAPRVGRQIDWHQDGVNWGHARMVSFMVFLDDASVENGCLEVVPGAHKYGLFPTVKTNVGEGMNVHDPLQAALLRQAVPLCTKAGEGLFFHSCMPHFSKANGSNHYRRNLTFAYVAEADKAAAAGGMAPIVSLALGESYCGQRTRH